MRHAIFGLALASLEAFIPNYFNPWEFFSATYLGHQELLRPLFDAVEVLDAWRPLPRGRVRGAF